MPSHQKIIKTDICVIGGGPAGQFLAAGTSQMGADTVLVERGKMGGNCFSQGCMSSKAMAAAGKIAWNMKRGMLFGLHSIDPIIDYSAMYEHIRTVIGNNEPNYSAERFKGLGVKILQAEGRFIDGKTLEAGNNRIQARRFVIATGSSVALPSKLNLDTIPFHTTDTIFSAKKFPERLIVIGGSPIACEIAQAHQHLGSTVVLLDTSIIMPRDDPELVQFVRKSLNEDGLRIHEGIGIQRIEKKGKGIAVLIDDSGREQYIEGSDVLFATKREVDVNSLNLKVAGVRYSAKGIEVDRRLRTSNRHIFAIGDCIGDFQSTHLAKYHAGIVIRNALFRIPAKVDYKNFPRVVFTSPELAQVGMTEAEARQKCGRNIQILRWPYHKNDRAQTQHKTCGMIKVIITPKGSILGAGIVGENAGELIQTWILAITQKMKIKTLARMTSPYPTLSEISNGVVDSLYPQGLFSDRTKAVVRFLARFG